MNTTLNMAFQLYVTFILGLDIKSFANGKSSVLKILLYIQTNSHIVVSLIVVFVSFYGFLVIIDSLFKDTNRKVCIC
jgi:hypothetical protein